MRNGYDPEREYGRGCEEESPPDPRVQSVAEEVPGPVDPLDARLDEAIAAGIKRGQAEKNRRRRALRHRSVAAAAACLALVACLFSIRISPAFATMLRDIPGLEKFVDLIENGDRGIKLALENELMQPIGATDEHDGRSLTVNGIIVDESRMVVFYELRNDASMEPFRMRSPELKDPQGETIKAGYGYGDGGEAEVERGRNVVRGTMDVWLQPGLSWPDKLTLTVASGAEVPKADPTRLSGPSYRIGDELPPEDSSGPEYRVSFAIDKAKFADMKRVYPIGKTISVEGQKITFQEAVVTPLRIALKVGYDSANTKKIFGAGDLQLVDEAGHVWTSNGGQDSTIYFGSSYFNQPKELYVEGSWFRALDRDKLEVVVDLDKKQILKAPDDRLKIENVTRSSDGIKLSFSLDNVPEEDKMIYASLFEGGPLKDGAGKSYDGWSGNAGGSMMNDSGKREGYVSIKDLPYVQPLTFQLFYYPSYIREPYRIRIW